MDCGFWYADLSLKFWASIELHILIFHSTILNTKSRRLFLHYLPLGLVHPLLPTDLLLPDLFLPQRRATGLQRPILRWSVLLLHRTSVVHLV